MRTKTRTIILAVSAAALLAVLLWASMFRAAPEYASIDPAETPIVETSGPPDAELMAEEVAGTEQPGQAAETRARAGEPKAATTSGTPTESPPNAEPLSAEQQVVLRAVETELAAALAGDNDQAIELSGFLNQCQFTFQDRARVENSIARAERSFAEGKPLTQFRPTSPAQKFDTLADFEASQWDTFFRCEATRQLINDDFWDNLEQQAEAGNPVARYLFATLMREPPSQMVAFENWDEQLQQLEQAREYTWQNLDEREPLGMLALVELEGFSLAMRGSSLSNRSVMILAAVKCGLSSPNLLHSVDQILQLAERLETTQPGILERLNTASDEARRMFCK